MKTLPYKRTPIICDFTEQIKKANTAPKQDLISWQSYFNTIMVYGLDTQGLSKQIKRGRIIVTGINKPLHRQRTVFTTKVSNSKHA
jgi:hypothetical protein